MNRKGSLIIVFSLVFTLLLNSFCFADPAEKKDIEILRGTGQVFAEIAARVVGISLDRFLVTAEGAWVVLLPQIVVPDFHGFPGRRRLIGL